MSKKQLVTEPPKRGTEAIDMRSLRFGYFPRTFIWRDTEVEVEAVNECWTVKEVLEGKKQKDAKVRYHFFRIRCKDGEYILYQDLDDDSSWHIIVSDEEA